MFQHLSAFCILGHFKNIKGIFLAVSTPVVLRRLDRCIHLIDPCSCQGRIPAACCQNTSASVKATGFTVILSCNIHKPIRPGQCREHDIIFIVIDICNIPGKAQAISVVFALGNVSRPFLGKSLRIDQIFFHQLMKPLDSLFIAFLHSCINDGSIIFHCKMITGVTITFSKSVDENCRILIAVIDDKGHWDHLALNIKFFLQLVCIVTKSDQHFLQFICCSRNFQIQIIQPFFINVRNIANSLDRFFSLTKLLDPWKRIDMSIWCSTHRSVLRIFFKYSLKMGHIFVDQVFYRNNDTLFCVAKKIIVAHSCIKKAIRKISKLGKCQILFVIKLI